MSREDRSAPRPPFAGLRPAAPPPELRARALHAARSAARNASREGARNARLTAGIDARESGLESGLGRLIDRLWRSGLLAPTWAAAALLLAVLGLTRPWAPAPDVSPPALHAARGGTERPAPEPPAVLAELGDVPSIGWGLAPAPPTRTWSRESLRPDPPEV